jgi:hypothetical protein
MKQIKSQFEPRDTARLHQILATDEELLPSSGFLAGVMEQVQREAAAPPPIPFPWKRAIPGMVLAAAVFGWAAVELLRLLLAAAKQGAVIAPHLSPGMVLPMQNLGWIALAAGLTIGSWMLARRLGGQRGLF